MNLKQCFLIKNNCYINKKEHKVKGIMVHSTGANNPNLRRYVQPNDGLLGDNSSKNHWNQPTPDNQSKCVHAFIGKLLDSTIATYQTLPWNYRGWHSGSGSFGSSKNANNNGYIGFEICEDGLNDKSYFDSVYKEAVELCIYLCKEFNLNPLTDIICHSEGWYKGVASNHGDVMHWFPRFGKSMDTFRSDVKKGIENIDSEENKMEIKDTVFTIGETEIESKLIDGVTYVPVREFIEVYKKELDIFWDKTTGAGLKF